MKTPRAYIKGSPKLFILLIFFITQKAESKNNISSDFLKYAACVENKLPGWVTFWRKYDSQFDVSEFHRVKQSSLKYQIRLSWSSFQKSQASEKSFCLFSPDSTKMADIYSYRYGLINEDGKVVLKGGEPDTQIKLIDLTKDSIFIFLTSGTPTEYQDAC